MAVSLLMAPAAFPSARDSHQQTFTRSAEPRDFVEYWAAARLFIEGRNPYSPAELHELERTAGWSGEKALIMWNPPWILPLLLPLGYLSFTAAQGLWLLLQVGALLIAAQMFAATYDPQGKSVRLCWILAISFVSSVFVLVIGQITPLVLLGSAWFVRALEKQRYWSASGALLLISIKPHLLYLFWIVLVLWVLHGQRWRLARSALVFGFAAALLPLFLDGQIYPKYLALYEYTDITKPLDWPAPTLRNAARILFAVENPLLQFAPTAIATIWTLWHWRRHRPVWRWDEQLPLLSMVAVASGFFVWTYDHVVMLPALWHAGIWIARSSVPWHRFWSLHIYLTINLLHGLLRFRLQEELWYVWLAPALLINYLIFCAERRRFSSDLRSGGSRVQ